MLHSDDLVGEATEGEEDVTSELPCTLDVEDMDQDSTQVKQTEQVWFVQFTSALFSEDLDKRSSLDIGNNISFYNK